MTSDLKHQIRNARDQHVRRILANEQPFPGRVGSWTFCDHCGTQFKVKVATGRYCTDRCRKNWHNNHVQTHRKRGVK